jgi:hypothetical protein
MEMATEKSKKTIAKLEADAKKLPDITAFVPISRADDIIQNRLSTYAKLTESYGKVKARNTIGNILFSIADWWCDKYGEGEAYFLFQSMADDIGADLIKRSKSK